MKFTKQWVGLNPYSWEVGPAQKKKKRKKKRKRKKRKKESHIIQIKAVKCLRKSFIYMQMAIYLSNLFIKNIVQMREQQSGNFSPDMWVQISYLGSLIKQ